LGFKARHVIPPLGKKEERGKRSKQLLEEGGANRKKTGAAIPCISAEKKVGNGRRTKNSAGGDAGAHNFEGEPDSFF